MSPFVVRLSRWRTIGRFLSWPLGAAFFVVALRGVLDSPYLSGRTADIICGVTGLALLGVTLLMLGDTVLQATVEDHAVRLVRPLWRTEVVPLQQNRFELSHADVDEYPRESTLWVTGPAGRNTHTLTFGQQRNGEFFAEVLVRKRWGDVSA